MADGKRALWTKLVADYELSEQSQRAFAEERQIELSALRYWIYKLRNESRPLVTDGDDLLVKSPEQVAPSEPSRLLPVRVVASAPKARRDGDGLLELEFPSGARLRFPPGTDLAYLRQLAAALAP
jgi:transposase